MATVGVIGAGSWGTALAKLLSENGHEVRLWCRRPELAEQLRRACENGRYLPGVVLPEVLRYSSLLPETVAGAAFLLIATPSHTLRTVLPAMPQVSPGTIVITAVKGIEPDTNLRMSQVIAGLMPGATVVALSGPSLAGEVARQVPTAVVAACEDLAAAQHVQALLLSPCFRVYTHRDIAGVELGGAFKNIIALAAGIAVGAGFGDNTTAALITRGLVEMTRLGTRLGADPITFAGLSGMGDLVLTCMSRQSRNRHVGEEIGRGRALQEVLASMHMVAEGVRTTQAVFRLAQTHQLDMPITREVYHVLFEHKAPRDAVNDLMMREAKMEKFG